MILIKDADDSPNTHCSIWTEKTPAYNQLKTGLIGNFSAEDVDSGVRILKNAFSKLKNQGIEYVIGPMDGSTWNSYRLVTEKGDTPPFFLEPSNPDFWPEIFIESGFDEIAAYSSTKTSHFETDESKMNRLTRIMDDKEIKLRSFNLTHPENDLEKVFQLSIHSFTNNFLYTPICFESFASLYRPILPYVHPDYFLIAEQNGKPVGFIFAIPDYSQKEQGKDIDTLIIKTVARDPSRLYAGIGSFLVYEVSQRSAQNGYQHMIHALMHESNSSLSISKTLHSNVIRRYSLFGKRL